MRALENKEMTLTEPGKELLTTIWQKGNEKSNTLNPVQLQK